MPKRTPYYDFDVIVIGTGAGGGIGAHTLAKMGYKIAIVEDDAVGGECPNFGCTPTKALLRAAELYRSAKSAKDYGIRASALNFSYPAVKKWKDKAVKNTGTYLGKQAFTDEGISFISGHAHFIGPNEISVGKRRYSARKFLIATGTHNFIPPIEGLDELGYITYREAIDLTKPPKSLLIIGGGAIGCEFSQLFASFGTKVTLAEFAPRLLFKEDADAGELVEAVFSQKLGINVLTSTKVIKITKKGGKKVVHYERHGEDAQIIVDEIMLATGKLPNTDLGLENAGVEYSRRGIKVNEYLQTTNKNIYAAGDVTGIMMFTHVASYQSRIAAHNMFKSTKGKMLKASYHAIPRVIFTDPEVAAVGLTEAGAKERRLKYHSAAAPISILGRANTSNQDIGFAKIIVNGRGIVIGGTVVSPHAGEVIHELAIAVQNGLHVEDIAHTVHAFPTWSEILRVVAAKLLL